MQEKLSTKESCTETAETNALPPVEHKSTLLVLDRRPANQHGPANQIEAHI